jgi:Tfp pilus assembly protein PilP
MESESLRMNVQYIGYVQSGNKVVALIILEGQTYAVESGDILETGVTIGKITPDDLEIIDSGSEPLRINLEGEEP